MRISSIAAVLALVSVSLLLAACGNEEEILAKKKQLDQIRTKYKALNAELAEKSPGWQEVKNAVIPARSALIAAKRSEDESATAAAQEGFDAASAAANTVIDEEKALQDRIRDLKDEIGKLEKAIKLLGGRP